MLTKTTFLFNPRIWIHILYMVGSGSAIKIGNKIRTSRGADSSAPLLSLDNARNSFSARGNSKNVGISKNASFPYEFFQRYRRK